MRVTIFADAERRYVLAVFRIEFDPDYTDADCRQVINAALDVLHAFAWKAPHIHISPLVLDWTTTTPKGELRQ
jgi:hypothetical protein